MSKPSDGASVDWPCDNLAESALSSSLMEHSCRTDTIELFEEEALGAASGELIAAESESYADSLDDGAMGLRSVRLDFGGRRRIVDLLLDFVGFSFSWLSRWRRGSHPRLPARTILVVRVVKAMLLAKSLRLCHVRRFLLVAHGLPQLTQCLAQLTIGRHRVVNCQPSSWLPCPKP